MTNGQPCGKRDGHNGQHASKESWEKQRVQHAAHERAMRAKHPEVKRARDARYYAKQVTERLVEQCLDPLIAENRLEKRLERQARWRAANSERLRGYGAKWRAAHPDYQKQWRTKNPEKDREYSEKHPEKQARYREEHHEEILARDAAYRAANPDRMRLWRADHPGQEIANHRRRRARKLAAFVENVLDEELRIISDGVCVLCNQPLDFTQSYVLENRSLNPWYPWLEHLVPLERHGLHKRGNLTMTHAFCNMSKGTHTLAELQLTFNED